LELAALHCGQKRADRVRVRDVAVHEFGDARARAAAEAKAAGDQRLELAHHPILGMPGEQMQVAPDLPKEAARIGYNRGHRGLGPNNIAPRARVRADMVEPGEPQQVLDIAQRAGTAFDVRLFLFLGGAGGLERN
jgi:hypothetical protein